MPGTRLHTSGRAEDGEWGIVFRSNMDVDCEIVSYEVFMDTAKNTTTMLADDVKADVAHARGMKADQDPNHSNGVESSEEDDSDGGGNDGKVKRVRPVGPGRLPFTQDGCTCSSRPFVLLTCSRVFTPKVFLLFVVWRKQERVRGRSKGKKGSGGEEPDTKSGDSSEEDDSDDGDNDGKVKKVRPLGVGMSGWVE